MPIWIASISGKPIVTISLWEKFSSILREFPENELNQPLEDLYLMGYELQRNAFFHQEGYDKSYRGGINNDKAGA